MARATGTQSTLNLPEVRRTSRQHRRHVTIVNCQVSLDNVSIVALRENIVLDPRRFRTVMVGTARSMLALGSQVSWMLNRISCVEDTKNCRKARMNISDTLEIETA